MSARTLALAAPLVVALTGAAAAQTPAPGTPAQGPGGTVATPQSNATGAPGAVTVSPNGDPAASKSPNSSAAGNAEQPSRAAPQGGGGGK